MLQPKEIICNLNKLNNFHFKSIKKARFSKPGFSILIYNLRLLAGFERSFKTHIESFLVEVNKCLGNA